MTPTWDRDAKPRPWLWSRSPSTTQLWTNSKKNLTKPESRLNPALTSFQKRVWIETDSIQIMSIFFYWLGVSDLVWIELWLLKIKVNIAQQLSFSCSQEIIFCVYFFVFARKCISLIWIEREIQLRMKTTNQTFSTRVTRKWVLIVWRKNLQETRVTVATWETKQLLLKEYRNKFAIAF